MVLKLWKNKKKIESSGEIEIEPFWGNKKK